MLLRRAGLTASAGLSCYELLNVVGDSCKSTLVLKRQAGILSMTFQFIRDTVIFLLTYAK